MTFSLSLFACALPALFFAGTASAQQPPDSAVIHTSAQAARSVRPDQATMTIRFSAPGETPAVAGRRLALRADTVRRALMVLGIPRDSLLTGSTWYWWPQRIEAVTRPRSVNVPGRGWVHAHDTILTLNGWSQEPLYDTTFIARELLDVRLPPDLVGRAIDAILALGIREISNLRFSASNADEARSEALREATERAQRQAATIAHAAGGSLGRLLTLSTVGDGEVVPRYQIEVAGVMAGGTEITAPAVNVSVTVTGRWRFLPR